MPACFQTNIKQTKFLSSVKFNIEPKRKIIARDIPKDFWNKGYGYCLEENLLFVWSIQDIIFLDLQTLELRSSINKLVKKEQAITYVYYNRSSKYVATGLINGNMKIWRLPLNINRHSHHSMTQSQVQGATAPTTTSQTHNEYIMIHNCIHHTKSVEKIIPGEDDRVIMSYSADLTLCLWSLETF